MIGEGKCVDMPTASDAALVRAAQAGDEQARGAPGAPRPQPRSYLEAGTPSALRAYFLMNASTASWASASWSCFGGDFIR